MKITTTMGLLSKLCCLFLLLMGMQTYAQEKGIQMEHNFSHKKVFYVENTRVKLKTADGKRYVGRYTIIDENTISIDGTPIYLKDIVKLKKRSMEGEILRPLLVVFGGFCILGAVIGAGAGGYGYIATVALLPPGLGTVLPVALTSGHNHKDWSYSIITKMDNTQK